MEEQRWNGDIILTNNPSQRQFSKALEDTRNKAIVLHKPGSVIRHPSGARYKVRRNGHWQEMIQH